MYFVFEYMAGGSLYELMKSCIESGTKRKDERLSTQKIRLYVKQILEGLSYIHDQGYIHRDIKPENILLNGNGDGCKVADFGLARQFSRVGEDGGGEGDDNKLTYYVSTRWYRAPEVILRCLYGKPIDVFATGLILAELYSLHPLLPGLSEIDQLNKMVALLGPPTETSWKEGATKMKQLNFSLVPTNEAMLEGDERRNIDRVQSAVRCALPEGTLPEAIAMIRNLIAWNPASRPSANDALQHEYFKSSTVLRRTKDSQSEAKEGVSTECADIQIMEQQDPIRNLNPLHPPFRLDVGEIVAEQRVAVDDALGHIYFHSCADPVCVDCAASSEYADIRPCAELRRHPFRHSLGEIAEEQRADDDDALRHDIFQTTALLRDTKNIFQTEFSGRVDENSMPTEVLTRCHNFRHDVGEIIIDQRKHSNIATLKRKPNPPMATVIDREENEFCNYLDAISNAECEPTSVGRSDCVNNPFDKSLQLIIPEGLHSNSVVRVPFHQGTLDFSTSKASQRSQTIARSSQKNSSMHNEMSTTINGRLPKPHSSRYSHSRRALADKPRWLLSNQNMGRGAMEVSISRIDLPVANTCCNNLDVRKDDRSEHAARDNGGVRSPVFDAL